MKNPTIIARANTNRIVRIPTAAFQPIKAI